MENKIDRAARIAHEVNRVWCREATKDDSQLPWKHAPQWQKDSIIAGVRAVQLNPGMTPELSHLSWMSRKESDGWKYGPEKNPDLRTHPCMMPFSDLPFAQRAKDEVFLTIVRLALAL